MAAGITRKEFERAWKDPVLQTVPRRGSDDSGQNLRYPMVFLWFLDVF